ncbi:hypothetical protein C8F04DRAFT_1175914 [Mycena alexandri]|uniref:BAG domain-containing protein n=1 Tax=Mycena alexandri TaxID=1745969 RepID=A0AAD6TBB3_9AGAR|nr:hypothetical protein C8F04DRAFT_1175914 [Mycena alexandri]
MFSFYPRPQPYYPSSPYQTYHQPSPYARALAQQQQRARALAQEQEMERQRAARSRYFPEGYDYQPESDDEDYYITPRQRAFIEAKRRQEALEQRRQAAARLAHENAMEQARTAEKESVSTTLANTPLEPAADSDTEYQTPPQSPLRRSVSPPVTRTPTPPPTVSSPPSPSPELLEEAATKIQTKYRIHRSLRAISELASQFESLKSTFVPPTTIDYQAGDGTIVSVPVPATPASAPAESAKLAFTPKNVPLHTYMEFLSRLLVALDGVESRGDRGLRERRRGVVRAVEAEAARVEALWRSVWASHLEQEQQQHVAGTTDTSRDPCSGPGARAFARARTG